MKELNVRNPDYQRYGGLHWRKDNSRHISLPRPPLDKRINDENVTAMMELSENDVFRSTGHP